MYENFNLISLCLHSTADKIVIKYVCVDGIIDESDELKKNDK